ncbi:HNH endonuclease [Celeribacter neptunius]|uniref:HNH endonuclease n=1 Tax=Celeribacter neptunius TaxID=588602 RepID=A0A1I3VBN9_9RHOB|nr:hypothetical protein [Celeribacter neptunius]SFJ92612.1 hypothetical protein SAMN04487991_3294 [Celeribacter neptunius]
MAKRLAELGIGRGEILTVLKQMRDIPKGPHNWSGKTFLVDPDDGSVWDLKPAIREAYKNANAAWNDNDYWGSFDDELRTMGFSYLKFDKDSRRSLGLSGYDPEAFYDRFTVFYPDGAEKISEEGEAPPWEFPSNEAQTERPSFSEKKVAVVHKAWERRGVNTRKIKEEKGYVCEGCELDAIAAYGAEIATSVIEAHHLKPVAEMPPEGRVVDPDDFAVLCATCHRIIHRLDSPDDLDGLREMVRGK